MLLWQTKQLQSDRRHCLQAQRKRIHRSQTPPCLDRAHSVTGATQQRLVLSHRLGTTLSTSSALLRGSAPLGGPSLANGKGPLRQQDGRRPAVRLRGAAGGGGPAKIQRPGKHDAPTAAAVAVVGRDTPCCPVAPSAAATLGQLVLLLTPSRDTPLRFWPCCRRRKGRRTCRSRPSASSPETSRRTTDRCACIRTLVRPVSAAAGRRRLPSRSHLVPVRLAHQGV